MADHGAWMRNSQDISHTMFATTHKDAGLVLIGMSRWEERTEVYMRINGWLLDASLHLEPKLFFGSPCTQPRRGCLTCSMLSTMIPLTSSTDFCSPATLESSYNRAGVNKGLGLGVRVGLKGRDMTNSAFFHCKWLAIHAVCPQQCQFQGCTETPMLLV